MASLSGHESTKSNFSGLTAFQKLQVSENLGSGTCSVAWLPQQRDLLTGSMDGTVKVWRPNCQPSLAVLGRHGGSVSGLAVMPDGRFAVSSSSDGTLKIWDLKKKELRSTLRGFNGPIRATVLNPIERTVYASADDGILKCWDLESGIERSPILARDGSISALAVTPDGKTVIAGSTEGTIQFWDAKEGCEQGVLLGHSGMVNVILSGPWDGKIVSGAEDRTVMVWDLKTGRAVHALEGHVDAVRALSATAGGQLLASKSDDLTIRFWDSNDWLSAGVIALPESESQGSCHPAIWPGSGSLTFHPTEPVLAVAGGPKGNLYLWHVDRSAILGSKNRKSGSKRYANAKVVVLGDSGVGKTGLAQVLAGQPFMPTVSTHGRHVWKFEERTVKDETSGSVEVRETLLWDLAGQPSYRLIHQLHLNEVAIALVLFDVRSEIDPFGGVRYWDRALRQALHVEGIAALPLKKFLVAARSDRCGVAESDPRIVRLIEEFGFDGFFQTSAKEAWGVTELAEVIRNSIPWDDLPKVSSTNLFKSIKAFLVHASKSCLLGTSAELMEQFSNQMFLSGNGTTANRQSGKDLLRRTENWEATSPKDLRAAFDTCIGRLEARGLLRRLSFGDLVLLRPELLDAYASSLIQAARECPDGLGSISEEAARSGRFQIPAEERIGDSEQEGLLCNVMVEDLLRHEIAIREQTAHGPQLVFPSQFTREWEESPDPLNQTAVFTFDGAVMNIYATLAVRLAYSGIVKKANMWRNAATYSAESGGTCGIFLRLLGEGKGELTLFFDADVAEDLRIQVEETVHLHLRRKSSPASLRRRRIFVCRLCGEPVPDRLLERRRQHGFDWVLCGFCQNRISLEDSQVELREARVSIVQKIDEHANRMRDREVTISSANGELQTRGFLNWAGNSARATVALVFTDMVGSTALTGQLGDVAMDVVRRAHFQQGYQLIDKHGGYKVKTLGDGFLAAFPTAETAVDFACEFAADTGNSNVRIKTAIHVGPVTVEEGDVFGSTVNFTARLEGCTGPGEVTISDRAKGDLDLAGNHAQLNWIARSGQKLKGFEGQEFLFWTLHFSQLHRTLLA